jgi:hypothetical protein
MKWTEYIEANLWTLAGTSLALITLSGHTRRLGLIIASITLVLHLITSLLGKESE